MLVSVQGNCVEGFPFASTLQLLSKPTRPLTLSFRTDDAEATPPNTPPSRYSSDDGDPLILRGNGGAEADTGLVGGDSDGDSETTPRTLRQREWNEAKYIFNEQSGKKGIRYMLENKLIDSGDGKAAQIAELFHECDARGLDRGEIGEFLAGGDALNSAVRQCYVQTIDTAGVSFVATLRDFLQGFKLPGESMLIERIMATFATRFYEQNPSYAAHLTDEKVGEYRQGFADHSLPPSADPEREGYAGATSRGRVCH